MCKNILLAGASGLVGNNLLNILLKKDSNLILLSRKKVNTKKGIKQIITNFNELDQLDNKIPIDTVYIAIGKRLSLIELVYLKKKSHIIFLIFKEIMSGKQTVILIRKIDKLIYF